MIIRLDSIVWFKGDYGVLGLTFILYFSPVK